jgi:outer membrane lipoprotein-sorting protein
MPLRRRFFLFSSVVLAAVLGSAAARSAPAPAAAGDATTQLHWKSDMTVERFGITIPSETWIKGNKVRVVAQTPVGESVTVIRDGTAWVKTPMLAMKAKVGSGSGAGSDPGLDIARDLDAFLAKGTKLGTETVDGEVCDMWKTTRTEQGKTLEMTLWISPTLKFPRQIRMQTEMGDALIRNREIEKKVALADSEFEPDRTVTYREMSDVLMKLQQDAGAASPR